MAGMVRLVLIASVGLALSSSVFAAAPTVSTEVVVDKIDSPWDMAFMKDGTMFFTEKCKGLSVRLPSRCHKQAAWRWHHHGLLIGEP